MQIKNQRDFWSGLMFVVVGLVFAVGVTSYPLGSSAQPGTGYFPLILSVLMIVLGLIVLFKALTIEADGGNPIGRVAWRPLLVIVLAIAVFGLTINRLGLAVSVPLLIVITSFAGDEFRWKGVVVNAAVLTVASWGIFIAGLKLSIPLWPVLPTWPS